MDTSQHRMEDLFFQLGLASDEKDIRAFIDRHRPLPPNMALTEADFWTETQAAFLTEALAEDSDWCSLVDQLDCYLREKYSWIKEPIR